jgi:hypothetical protein
MNTNARNSATAREMMSTKTRSPSAVKFVKEATKVGHLPTMRKSFSEQSSRRQSANTDAKQQEEMLRIFFTRQGVSAEDISDAFSILSTDGKKITQLDLEK